MSGQASAGVEQAPERDDSSLSEAEIETIREAEAEQRMKRINGDDPQELTLDRKFELLKNQRRRRVIRHLMENGESSTTGELAEHVAVLENDKPHVGAITSKERKAAYVGLYQCHLPKMDDYGIIEFNQARGRVELTELAYELEDYLGWETGPRWPLWYLGIAGVGAALYGLSTFVLGPVAPPVVAVATMLAVFGTAVRQWWGERPA
jgi:hypothetical protein